MELDKFYTKLEIAAQCIEYFQPYICNQIVIEPSAGNGSFSDQINCLAYDIKPEKSNIIKQDFLQWEPPNQENNYVFIGNPPFGKKSNLAINFFNHASKYADYIGFIVPVSFMKWSVQKQLNPNFKLLAYYYLPVNSFLVKGQDYEIRTVFQIWGKEGNINLRLKKSPDISHKDFEIWQYNATPQSINTIDQDWKYALYRQGFHDYNQIFTKRDYNFIKEKMTGKKKTQFFFFKPLIKKAEKIFFQMDFNNLAARNTITPGFGKGDFVSYYQELEN